MSNDRRAALALHSVDAAEREWVLSQLEPRQRQSLRALLEELGSLGIEQQTPVDHLATASAQDVKQALSEETVGVIALALSLQELACREACLRSFAPYLRIRIEQGLVAEVPSALALSMRNALVQRLATKQAGPLHRVAEQAPTTLMGTLAHYLQRGRSLWQMRRRLA